MSSFRQLAASFLAGAAVAFAAAHFTPSDSEPSFSRSHTLGQAELDEGGFSIWAAGVSTPIAFVWCRDVAGQTVETWALFRPTEQDGWEFPSSNNTSVTITIDYENAGSYASDADFLDWCEEQYPSNMSVDKAEDFEVHDHEVKSRIRRRGLGWGEGCSKLIRGWFRDRSDRQARSCRRERQRFHAPRVQHPFESQSVNTPRRLRTRSHAPYGPHGPERR